MKKLIDILKEAEPRKFKDDLLEFIIDPDVGGVSPNDLANAPPLVKAFIFIEAFDLTVGNSGIYKWLIELYDDYPKLGDFFEAIGANSSAAYVRAAIKLFPHGTVPKNMDKRFDFCDEHEDELDGLDRKFKGASDEALLKFREYIIAHRDEFETQVKKFWTLRKSHRRY